MPRCLAVTAALLIAACGTRPTPTSTPAPAGARWFATWGAAEVAAPARPPRDSIDRTPTLVGQTLRLIVRTSIGGDHARIRLSNEYGDRPLVIGAAHIAVRDTGAVDRRVDRSRAHVRRQGRDHPAAGRGRGERSCLDRRAQARATSRCRSTSPIRRGSSTRHALALQTNYVGRGNVAGERASRPTRRSFSGPSSSASTSRTPPRPV